MEIYIVTYDLRKELSAESYNSLVSLIKEEGVWACLGESSYLIQSNRTAVELRDRFKTVLDSDDMLYVGRVTAPAAWTGYSTTITNWIKSKL